MNSALKWLGQVFNHMRDGITLSNAGFETNLARVNSAASDISDLSDADLKTSFAGLRQSMIAKPLAKTPKVEALAIVREAASRTLSMRPYDVQMLAAAAMLEDKCVEMQTGEGKTLAAAVTNCIRASGGHGVHVLTFNDYLAQRDAKWMAPLYHFLGMTVGHISQGMPSSERRAA